MIRYVVGDATQPIVEGPKIIAHVCNDAGWWGRGFVLALSKRWREPEACYRDMSLRGVAELGSAYLVPVEPDLWVANLIAQHGVHPKNGRPPIRYSAFVTCLRTLGFDAGVLGASVHVPRLGAGLAGGKWEFIEQLLIEELVDNGVAVTVYDLPTS